MLISEDEQQSHFIDASEISSLLETDYSMQLEDTINSIQEQIDEYLP